MERQQRGGAEEVEEEPIPPVSPLHKAEWQEVGLAEAVPSAVVTWRGTAVFRRILGRCSTLDEVGRALAWVLFNCPGDGTIDAAVRSVSLVVRGRQKAVVAMHRGPGKRHRSLFPMPLGTLGRVKDLAQQNGLEEFSRPHFAGLSGVEIWQALSLGALNGLAGHDRAPRSGRGTDRQKKAVENLGQVVQHALEQPFVLDRSAAEAEKELSGRFLTYTGEEVPKMQILSKEQVEAALPPKGHGGSIPAVDLVCEGTKRFLLHPEESLLQEPLGNQKLQAKVHIVQEDRRALCELLVERNICVWVPEAEVLQVGSERVLNGLFAVGKGTHLQNGRGEVQRLIMNLKPSNSVFHQVQGSTGDLPAITQYLSMVISGSEQVALFQSDMSSAFYLFRIPDVWSRYLSFNICFKGSDIGRHGDDLFYLGCCVIPMGWSSAVSVMQEIAERLSVLGRLPREHQVRRRAPLPPWMVETLETAKAHEQTWFHVYLDNFCCMERGKQTTGFQRGERMHESLEMAWDRQGVVSSAKKKVVASLRSQELGAELDGDAGILGPSVERLLKLIQVTLVVLSKPILRRKWVQVIAGRWVHILSFRRPGMALFDDIWKYVSGTERGVRIEMKTRAELFGIMMAALLLRTNLRAEISEVTTASDASMTGGAVGKSNELTTEGATFASMDRRGLTTGTPVPVLVLSLFNGIGCAFRCYDLCGLIPAVAISYETNADANRVTSRRWPAVQQCGDVKTLTRDVMQSWRYQHPEIVEIHLWAGFPCVDLTAVKWGRMNLNGESSGLFWEVVRILKELKQIFGFDFVIKYVVENVASMDRSAEKEISTILGVKPLRLDCADVVPIHRPRFCWTNLALEPMDHIFLEEKEHWIEVQMEHEYPAENQWLTPGAEWPGGTWGTVLPTAMRALRRSRPPPKPAGLHRASQDAVWRWEADEFRFPPYQYADQYVVWVENKWRLVDASEREILHGLGFGHTSLCWNAGKIKGDPKGFEDMRKSLIGDGFSCFSFAFVAAQVTWKFHAIGDYSLLWDRMGMAPGYCCPVNIKCALGRTLQYGNLDGPQNVQDLHRCLLRRVNHTGSDIRISTGTVMNPRCFPRQSVAADWWAWKKVFAFKWSRQDHINNLELRAILHSVEWRINHLKECVVRIFHLTDSYVCMSIIGKGRSSSQMLQPLLKRLAALLMAYDIFLCTCHVESLDNPTDEASRN